MSTLNERKYDDEVGIRFTKDDSKQQSVIDRRGTKEPAMMPIHEQVVSGQDINTNGSLAPIVQPSALKAEMSHLHHVEHIDDRSVPSLEMLGETHIVAEKPKALGRKKLSGDPIPSQLELPGAIGEKAAEGWDAIMERAQPQIEKAQELYRAWKGEENKQVHGTASGPSMMDQAKEKIHDIQAAAGPMIHDLKEKATETIGLVQRKGEQTIRDLKSKSGGSDIKSKKAVRAETMQHRMMRYRNKALEIWEGQEPMVKARIQQGVDLAKRYRMEIPLLALGTLLVLWASISFIGWLAFPATPAQGIVEYHPQDFNAHLLRDQANHAHMNGLHQGLTGQSFKQHEIHTGPLQDVPGPGMVDKLMMKLNSIEAKLQHSIDTLKMHGTDRLGHLKEAMPTPSDIHLQDRMGHLKDAIRNTVPSMPEVPSMPSMDQLKDRMPSMDNLKDRMPSMDEIKDRMPSMPSVDSIKAAIPTSLDALKDGMQNLKDRVNGVSGEPDNLRSGIDEFYRADLGQSQADMSGLPHEHSTIPAHDHIMQDGHIEHVPEHQH